jgi:serine/threonine protein kinase
MAYYPGESLRQKIKKGSIPFDEAIYIFQQISRGLQAAHEEKIIHRDIKPGNILITEKGEVKIVDFGLAKLAGVELTRSTSSKGTAAYMCPEQIRGQKVDHRSDIWALGVVLYEMLTGQLPFGGDYPESLMYAIVNKEPQLLSHYLKDVPELLQEIINKMLKKEPGERYQDISKLLLDLEPFIKESGVTTLKPRTAIRKIIHKKKTYLYSGVVIILVLLLLILGKYYLFPEQNRGKPIAVLPLENITNDPEQEWFSDGITDALITELAKISGLRVTSRSTAMKYKGTMKTPPEIATELGVAYLVEASVVKSSERLTIIIRLINAPKDEYIWADNYDAKLKDVPVLFSEVAQNIAAKTETELTMQERKRFAKIQPVDPEAYELYLKGTYHFNKYLKPDINKATDYFQKAIKADSSFAKPYAGLIYCYGFFTYFGEIPREEGIPKIRNSINKALELDENLAEAYQGLAAYRVHQEWDWEGAEEAFKRALTLNPNLSGIYGTEYAWYLIYIGRTAEAISEAQRLLQLDPLSYVTRMTANYVYYCVGQYDKAIKLCQRTIELEPQNPLAYEDLARNFEQLSKHEDAHKCRLSALKLFGLESIAIADYDSLYRKMGSKAYPTWLLMYRNKLMDWSNKSTCDLAWIFTRLGENERALFWLEKAYEAKDGALVSLKTDPKWDSIREEPRFQDLVQKMRFPD